MAKFMQKAVLGATLAATALTAAAPADAQRWRGRRDRGGDVAAGAIIGGIVGLGVGAAIASANRDRWDDPRFRRGWRGDRFYDPRLGWQGGYDPRFAYDPRFQDPRFGYDPRFQDPRFNGGWGGWGQRCYTVRDRDPWTGRRIRTRVCD